MSSFNPCHMTLWCTRFQGSIKGFGGSGLTALGLEVCGFGVLGVRITGFWCFGIHEVRGFEDV